MHRVNISVAVSHFATKCVQRIVEHDHQGTLVYSGGDDVLALLPTEKALAAASAIKTAFKECWEKHGPKGVDPITVSAGLAVVHYKEDLRFALDAARKAEKKAKESGRNTLFVSVCRRSGEHSSSICPWDYVDTVAGWVNAFVKKGDKPGASDRWAYHLAAELPTLRGLAVPAMLAEIRRQVNRSETATKNLLRGTDEKSAGELMAEQFGRFQSLVQSRQFEDARCLTNFITLCQTASFLARGRDE